MCVTIFSFLFANVKAIELHRKIERVNSQESRKQIRRMIHYKLLNKVKNTIFITFY